jgi:transcriptional regulator with XRE-family HTH domain
VETSTTIPLTRAVFARRLRELRVPKGYRTARSFARALGIDENRYTRYERAEVEPDLALLLRICEVLAVTPNDLLIEAMSARGLANGSLGDGTGAPGDVENAKLNRRTAAWRLAQFVAHLEAGNAGEPPDAPGDLQTLQRWSQLHATIDRDPFAFVAAITSDARFIRLEETAQKKIAELIGELTAAVDAHARALRA